MAFSKKTPLIPIPSRGHYTETARLARVDFIKKQTPSLLHHVGQTSFDAQKLSHNVESFLGSVEIPIGVAGPLLIAGEHAQGTFYAPIATTEGALVASINRGAYAASLAGGITTRVIGQRMTRVPLFIFSNMSEAMLFSQWVDEHISNIEQETQKHSNYAELFEIRPQIIGKAVHIHFVYKTGDASGQNMTTTCTWEACKWIKQELEQHPEINIKRFYIDGSLSADKKVSVLAANVGRGIAVQAEVTIPDKIVRRILKTSASELVDFWNYCISAYIATGVTGANINVANVVAGIFTATGQDIASVHESAVANTTVSLTDAGDLYWCITMPSLPVGTVGGGTGLHHQRECLEMLDCYGAGNALKLAEIIACYCLALDLSTGAAITAGHFATAHEKLGRNRVTNHLKLADFTPHFIQPYLATSYDDTNLKVINVKLDNTFELKDSIVTEMTSRKLRKTVGLFPFSITYESDKGNGALNIMVKVKPTALEILNAVKQLMSMCDENLFEAFNQHKACLGVEYSDKRELALYQQTDERFTRNTPKIFGVYEDADREAYVVLMERLIDMELMNSVDDISLWQEVHFQAAFKGLAECHSIWYQDDELLNQPWLAQYPIQQNRNTASEFYLRLIEHGAKEFPEFLQKNEIERLQYIVRDIPIWWSQIESMPHTLVHNDFNPRNITFRRQKKDLCLCVYDWELATWHIPQVDLVELLIYTAKDDINSAVIKNYIENYRRQLEVEINEIINPQIFRKGFVLALMDFAITRMPMYLLTHTFRESHYIPRLCKTVFCMLDIVSAWGYSELPCLIKKMPVTCNEEPTMEVVLV